ncbi:hypothetical protein [Tepidimicrobium xylanilyticum]
MQNDIKVYTELLELLNMQTETINKQNKIITELVNDNLEKENMINELIKQEQYLY